MRAARWCALLAAGALASPAADPALEKLEREMARVARVGGGVVGAVAIHIESGRQASLHAGERFPMASSYKIPIAVKLLDLVDAGRERLDRMVTLEPADLHPGSGTLTALFNKPGVALSVRNLLELMLLISDNSATDVLLRLAGGPEAVTARMRELGVDGIQVSRPTARLIADWSGVSRVPPESEWTPDLFRKLALAVSAEDRRKAADAFDTDPRDTATPEAMARLLARIHRKELHKPDTAELLLDILRRCQTGEARLKGILPAGTVVAHKTGTIGRTTNDVGIVTLPDGAGHVALAVFVKASEKDVPARERAIAEIARAVHDFFLFQPASPAAAPSHEALAARILAALRLGRGERVFFGATTESFRELTRHLGAGIEKAGAREVASIDQADVYLWLPAVTAGMTSVGRKELADWLDRGGPRRQIHFHWGEGSVLADGLAGRHSPELDAVYQDALDIDYAALSAAQDRAIALLRSGVVRVRTPAGADVSFRVGNRPFNKQDGEASAARMTSARVRIDREIELPAGVLRVAPIEESVRGRIVIPSARFGDQTARGLRLEFANGRLKSLEAGENQALVEKALSAGGDAARSFREFALGFNPKLRAPAGSPVLPYYGYGAGVVRLSLGDNQELGGAVRGGFVRWFFFPDATVSVNGKVLVQDGRLLP